MGQDAAQTVDGRHGSHPVQPLDLLASETACGWSGNGAPGAHESYQCGKEKERYDRRPDNCRSAACESVSLLLRDPGRAEGDAPADAVPAFGGGRTDDVQE